MKLIIESIKKAILFIKNDIWTSDIGQLPRWQRNIIKTIRITIIAVKEFKEKELILRSSALTFYTLLSIVPVVAMIFGIAKGFGLDELMRKELFKYFHSQPQILQYLLTFSESLLKNTQGGLVAGIGFGLLIWSVLQVLGNIEEAFNSIWHIKNSRSWIRKFTDYLAIMLIVPLFVILSGSITVFFEVKIDELANEYALVGSVKDWIFIGFRVVPYLIIWTMFTMIFMVMPNTKVKISAAIIAGIIAGTCFQVFEHIFISMQIGVARYNAIYGSFASFPLFITFLQLSWTIILIGCEIAYSIQNLESYENQRLSTSISPKMKFTYAMVVLQYISRKFKNNEGAPSPEEISKNLEIPFKISKDITDYLHKCGLIVEVLDENIRDVNYHPAMDLSYYKVNFVLEKLETEGRHFNSFSKIPSLDKFLKLMNDIDLMVDESDLNKNILDI